VIPPGVDLSQFYPIPVDEARLFIGRAPDDRIILFVGRIEPLKGLDTLLRAVACLRLRDLKEPMQLVVIGGDPDAAPEDMDAEMARLQKMCTDLTVGKMVAFLGKRSQDTLPYYYSAVDVLVMPSHYESFGMVALEAMACGTPVVASQVGGLAFLVQDGVTGYTVPESDDQALCERLTAILGDPGLRRKLGLNAASEARAYSWDKIAGQILAVYEELGKNQNRVSTRNPVSHISEF